MLQMLSSSGGLWSLLSVQLACLGLGLRVSHGALAATPELWLRTKAWGWVLASITWILCGFG